MWWDGPYFHPREFRGEEVNGDLVTDLRGAKADNNAPKCNAPAALSSARNLFPAVRRCGLILRKDAHVMEACSSKELCCCG